MNNFQRSENIFKVPIIPRLRQSCAKISMTQRTSIAISLSRQFSLIAIDGSSEQLKCDMPKECFC